MRPEFGGLKGCPGIPGIQSGQQVPLFDVITFFYADLCQQPSHTKGKIGSFSGTDHTIKAEFITDTAAYYFSQGRLDNDRFGLSNVFFTTPSRQE